MTLPRGEWLSSGPPRRGWLSSGARPTARPMGSGWIGLVPCTVVQYTSLVRAWPSTHQDGEEKTERGQTLEEPVKGPIRRPEGNEALRGQPSTGSLDQILWSIVADCTSSTVQGGRTTCWGITTGNTRVRCSTTDGAPGGARRHRDSSPATGHRAETQPLPAAWRRSRRACYPLSARPVERCAEHRTGVPGHNPAGRRALTRRRWRSTRGG